MSEATSVAFERNRSRISLRSSGLRLQAKLPRRAAATLTLKRKPECLYYSQLIDIIPN
jgi:hypothetical protein